MLLLAGGQLLPLAPTTYQTRNCTAASGPGSSEVQQTARQRQPRRRRLQCHSQTQLMEPDLSWQALEALFIQEDSTPAWHGISDQHSITQHAQTQLLVQLNDAPESIKEKEDRRKRQDFYANAGDAIRTLREDIPRLFMRDFTCALSAFNLLGHNTAESPMKRQGYPISALPSSVRAN